MAGGDVYSDPKFSQVKEVGLGAFDSNAAAARKAAWKPYAKAKVLQVACTVFVAGSLACGFNIYKNSASIGQIVCSASAYGYRGTLAINSVYDTTDALSIANIDSNASLKASLSVVYQDQY